MEKGIKGEIIEIRGILCDVKDNFHIFFWRILLIK
jgi:hypothetical protein